MQKSFDFLSNVNFTTKFEKWAKYVKFMLGTYAMIYVSTRGNTEKIWVDQFFVRQNTNISKVCKFNLVVRMNDTYCTNDHKMD